MEEQAVSVGIGSSDSIQLVLLLLLLLLLVLLWVVVHELNFGLLRVLLEVISC